MFTKAFWKAAAERAIKTFAQTFGATALAAGTGLLDTDWQTLASVSGMAAVLSIATSLASAPVGNAGPSLAGEELTDGA